MATASDFTPAEWELLGHAPLAAGTVIARATPGHQDTEAAAILKGWREAGATLTGSQLIQELVRDLDPASSATQKQGTPATSPAGDIVAEARILCDRAIGVLEHKATLKDVQDYQAFVLRLANVVAHMTKEGGFLGFGGTEVSRDEQRMLRQIADGLRFDG
jgi:hypothetical protein